MWLSTTHRFLFSKQRATSNSKPFFYFELITTKIGFGSFLEKQTHFRKPLKSPITCFLGSTPELLGSTPEPLGSNPEPLGSNPEPLGSTPKPLGMTPKPLGLTPEPLGLTPFGVAISRFSII